MHHRAPQNNITSKPVRFPTCFFVRSHHAATRHPARRYRELVSPVVNERSPCSWGGTCLLIDNDCVIISAGDVDAWRPDKFELNISDSEIHSYHGLHVANIIPHIKNATLRPTQASAGTRPTFQASTEVAAPLIIQTSQNALKCSISQFGCTVERARISMD